MSDYAVTIPQDSPVFKLYQKLKADGVKDADLDTGYPATDYVKKTRTITRKDHKVDATEVLNYALEHYERFQLALKETTGYDVPWSLDDLDPATHFDAGLREQVDHAIAAFRKVLADKGLETGSSRYNELLAVSLYAFALGGIPRLEGGYAAVFISPDVSQVLKKNGLSQVMT